MENEHRRRLGGIEQQNAGNPFTAACLHERLKRGRRRGAQLLLRIQAASLLLAGGLLDLGRTTRNRLVQTDHVRPRSAAKAATANRWPMRAHSGRTLAGGGDRGAARSGRTYARSGSRADPRNRAAIEQCGASHGSIGAPHLPLACRRSRAHSTSTSWCRVRAATKRIREASECKKHTRHRFHETSVSATRRAESCRGRRTAFCCQSQCRANDHCMQTARAQEC